MNPQVQAASVPLAWPPAPDPERRSRLREVAAERRRGAGAAAGPSRRRPRRSRRPALRPPSARASRSGTCWPRPCWRRRARGTPASGWCGCPTPCRRACSCGRSPSPRLVAMEIARPMPHPPAPAARRGTEFHAWVETRYGQQSLLDLDDLPGSADADIATDDALRALKEAFERRAVRAPRPGGGGGAVRAAGRRPGRQRPHRRGVRGRGAGHRLRRHRLEDGVVDATSIPMQLALYRLAWARLMDVPVEQVSAAFVIVGTGEVLRPDTEPPRSPSAR